MLRLRNVGACLFCLCAWLCVAQAQNQIFHISDVDSQDYKITNLVIEYSDGRVSDGFRILDGNQQRLVRWPAITSLELGALIGEGTPNKYVECTVRLSNATKLNLSCLDGTVLGKTRNGDYKKPLHQVTALIPLK